jgi:hypothetical protein
MAGEDVNSDHAAKEGSSSRTMYSVTLGRGGGGYLSKPRLYATKTTRLNASYDMRRMQKRP